MIFLSMLPSVAWAQEEMSAEEELDSTYTDINEHMELFQEELLQLNALCRFRMDIDMDMPLNEPLLDVVSERLKSLSSALNSFSTRWDTYSAAQQVYIADNDSLLNRSVSSSATSWWLSLRQRGSSGVRIRTIASYTKRLYNTLCRRSWRLSWRKSRRRNRH